MTNLGPADAAGASGYGLRDSGTDRRAGDPPLQDARCDAHQSATRLANRANFFSVAEQRTADRRAELEDRIANRNLRPADGVLHPTTSSGEGRSRAGHRRARRLLRWHGPLVQIGRGRNYAWSATSAGGDNLDSGSCGCASRAAVTPTTRSMGYLRNGTCRPIETFQHTQVAKPSAGGNRGRSSSPGGWTAPPTTGRSWHAARWKTARQSRSRACARRTSRASSAPASTAEQPRQHDERLRVLPHDHGGGRPLYI